MEKCGKCERRKGGKRGGGIMAETVRGKGKEKKSGKMKGKKGEKDEEKRERKTGSTARTNAHKAELPCRTSQGSLVSLQALGMQRGGAAGREGRLGGAAPDPPRSQCFGK